MKVRLFAKEGNQKTKSEKILEYFEEYNTWFFFYKEGVGLNHGQELWKKGKDIVDRWVEHVAQILNTPNPRRRVVMDRGQLESITLARYSNYISIKEPQSSRRWNSCGTDNVKMDGLSRQSFIETMYECGEMSKKISNGLTYSVFCK